MISTRADFFLPEKKFRTFSIDLSAHALCHFDVSNLISDALNIGSIYQNKVIGV